MRPNGLAVVAVSGARPRGLQDKRRCGFAALAQHMVVVAGGRLDREGRGLLATSGSKENTSFDALEVLAATHFNRSER